MTDDDRYTALVNALADAIADLPGPEAWQVLRAVWEVRRVLRQERKHTNKEGGQ